MLNNSNQTSAANVRFTWPDLMWRLLLTGLLLLLLAAAGLTFFGTVTTNPEAHVLPPLTQEVEAAPAP